MTVQERTKGFQKLLTEKNMTCDKVDLAFINPEKDLIQQYLESHLEIDGIFCDSDTIAAIVLAELLRLGKNVPKDVQVIGYDNTILAELTTPKLTTISQKMFEIGEEAIISLNSLIDKEVLPNKHKLIPVELIERDTTL